MQQVHLIRHAESASNAGLPTDYSESVPITDHGKEQAARFALSWGEPPDLIVTSPFIRTHMTAAPFVRRFPHVPQEQWDVEEWTMLPPGKYKGTTHAQRKPKVQAYWKRNDPSYCTGEGAESLLDLFRRVGSMLMRAAAYEERSIAIFTHGHFMRAVLYSILFNPYPSTPEAMQRFRSFSEALDSEILNLSMVTLRSHDNEWDYGGRWFIGKFWNLRP